jgi:hypothetical protein
MSPRLFVLTVSTFALTACGGSEEPTKQDYVAAVNQQCARIAQQTLDLANEHFGDLDGPPTDRQIRAYTEEAVVMQRDGLECLRDRAAPEGDAGRLDRLYETWASALDAAGDDIEGAEARRHADRFRQLATDYGLMKCAEM